MKQCKENKDLLAKEYLRDHQVFADLINLSLYQGKRIVHPKELEEADSVIQNKRRDVLKRWKREKGKEVYLGIEVQSTVDPTMPVRVMEYDVLCYRDQLKQKQKETNRNQLQKGEFLSGMQSGEKLHEVITVVLNLSGKRWSGARSLCEMLEEGSLASEYRIRVLDPVEIKEEEMRKCISEVGKLMRVMGVCEKKEEFEKCIKGEEYRRVGVKTAKMIQVFANIDLKVEKKEGEEDMCRAIEELKRDWKNEEKISTAKKMLADGFSDEMIAKYVELSLNVIGNLRKQILGI